jgi:hypothetical protein
LDQLLADRRGIRPSAKPPTSKRPTLH